MERLPEPLRSLEKDPEPTVTFVLPEPFVRSALRQEVNGRPRDPVAALVTQVRWSEFQPKNDTEEL